jgi:hypothetical protein
MAVVVSSTWLFLPALAQEFETTAPRAQTALELEASAPRGSMSFTYQYQKAQNLTGEGYVINSAPITTHLIDVAATYRIKDRWTVHAGLPFISREWKGGPSHNPLNIVPPQYDSEFVDDGHFHGFFQDLRLGASYLAFTGPITVEPYLEYGIPTTDYPFFAASAVGRNLQTLEFGSIFAYRPPFLPWYFSMTAGYVLVDSVLGVDTDAMRVTVDAVRFFNERIALNVFLTSKNGGGTSPVAGAPQDFTSERWYRHDQITRHNYASMGLGVDWSLGERNVMNFTILRMVHAEDIFKLREALSVSFSRPF